MKHNLVYKITNNLNGKIYIGVHSTNNINDNYMGSGIAIKAAIKKYGIENFTKEILVDYETAEIAYRLEKMLVNENFLKNRNTYNLNLGGVGGSLKGTRTAWNKGKKFEFKKRKPLSTAHKAILSAVKIGKPGHKHTEKHKKYMSSLYLGENNPFFGKQHSENTKNKISQATKSFWKNISPARKQEIIEKRKLTKRKNKGLV